MARILIADDGELIRASLRAALSRRHDWIVCGEAANGRQAVLMAAQLSPDLIILDFAMPMLDGMQAAQEILKIIPKVPVVLWTLHKSSQLDLEAAKAGIRKVFSKSEDSSKLIAGVEELLSQTTTSLGPLRLSEERPSEISPVEVSGVPPTRVPRKPVVPES